MNAGILIVDDSLTVRMDLAEAFEAAGLRPLLCATAAEAQAALAREDVALAILDVVLPDRDGISLLEEIRSSHASLPVLLLSTEAEVKDRIRGLKTGATDYVGKPYDRGYVVSRAEEILRAQSPQAARAAATVLVIDDSLSFRKALAERLAAGGYAVFEATDGEDGLRIASQRRPDAIIVDGVLPEMDGTAVIRRIRLDAALRSTPCILLTGADDRGAELRALDAGADAFVRKEDDLALVLARVAAVIRRPATERHDTASLLGPHRVLAVDDSQTYLQAVADLLRDEAFDVVCASSGEDALEVLAVQPVDCILLDVRMPGLSGTETCQRIKAAPVLRDIPLVMLTAAEDRDSMLQGLAAGADDYISKSSEFDVLLARVRAQIRRKQFEDEHRRVRDELLRSELDAAEARAAQKVAEARAKLVGELERKNEELEAFSYSVSHDLRAPLRSADGFSLALLEDCGSQLDDVARGHLERVRAATKRMGELIEDLLQLSRIGRAELDCADVDLAPIARSVGKVLETAHPDRKVELVVQDGMRVFGDPRLLRVVFENLLGNAWKFTSRVERARIEVGAAATGAGRVFHVKDNGAGFDMAHAQRLFTPFRRLHAQTDFPGTGIGLATVRRIIDRHDGRIWAEAEPGKGASLYFTIGDRS